MRGDERMDIVYTIWLRNMKRYLRSKSRIVGSLGMPMFFLLIIGFGLNSIVQVPGMAQGYTAFLIPGIVSMSVLFTSMFSGIQVIWDRQFGFLKETLVAPVSRMEIMIGQTLGGATTSFIQGSIILSISLLIGLSALNAGGFLLAFAFMLLIGISFTAMGIAIASKMNDMHGFQLIMNFVIFPIFGLSGALFPIETLPGWLKSLTLLDPLTYGVEGVRYGLLGTSHIDPMLCFAVLSCFAAAMLTLGAYFFRKINI
jgi:ABC-2 type transport system permease protein